MNPRRSGTAYAIDGRETWLVHNYLRADEKDFEAVDRDWALRTILGVDGDFEYQLLAKEDWFGRRLIADRFRHGRIFLCGDSAHIWVPYAGYGMNAGIADAADLAWLLAGHLAGWAPPGILDAYERERRPITDQVSRFAMDHAERMIRSRGGVPADIEAEGPAGDAARASFGRAMVELNVAQYCCAGLNFGYYYDDSPIIAYDGETHPPYTMGDFTPATVPGCRLPHIWLANGALAVRRARSRLHAAEAGPRVETARLEHAAQQRGLPLTVLDLADESPTRRWPPADAGPARSAHRLARRRRTALATHADRPRSRRGVADGDGVVPGPLKGVGDLVRQPRCLRAAPNRRLPRKHESLDLRGFPEAAGQGFEP